jgi:hypothetical protein
MWYKFSEDLVEKGLQLLKDMNRGMTLEERIEDFKNYELEHRDKWNSLQRTYFDLYKENIKKHRVDEGMSWEDILPWLKFKYWEKRLGQ